ncbi:unnamed protein product [Mytilus coruscus]|uniref:Uncharacterized protein n=1 Tax=Mytilus coruscus TaxID=42192 RepID=A0A6J8C8S6_MYTCO|nr:unnamed protein product [Mytilus coruscus]
MRKKNVHKNETKVEQVAPTVAIADRAVSELIQQKHDKEPHVRENKIKSVGIKRKKSKPTRIPVGKRKGATAKKQKSKRTAKPKKKLSKKNKTRKIDFETVPSIFDRHIEEMAYLNEENKDISIPMELDLFDEPKNQVAVDRIFYTETRPMSNFTSPDVSTVDFFVSGQGPEYMDLKRSRLYVRAKLIKADGTTFDDEDTSSIVNLPLQAMWSQMDVYMNNKLVSLNTSNYPWKAHLKTILTSGTDEQKSQLQSQLFMKDSGDLATTNGKNGANTGLILRRDFIKSSSEFKMEGPLFEDIFSLDRHLIQGVDLYIKLYRSTDQFFVISGEDTPSYKLQLLDCVYKACKIKVDPGVIVNHLKQIETKPVRYYFQRTEVKRNTINKDSREFIWDNMFTLRPSTLVLGLI